MSEPDEIRARTTKTEADYREMITLRRALHEANERARWRGFWALVAVYFAVAIIICALVLT